MPVPMIAPMPSSVRSIAVSVRLSALPPLLGVADQLLDRLGLEEIRIHSPSRKSGRGSRPRPRSAPGIGVKTAALYLERLRRQARDERSDARLRIAADKQVGDDRDRGAPAATTSGARSSVMPPIATTGLPRPPRRTRTRSRPRGVVAGRPSWPSRRRPDGDVARVGSASAASICARSCVERPTIASGPTIAAPRPRQIVWPTWTPSARASRAMSARSLRRPRASHVAATSARSSTTTARVSRRAVDDGSAARGTRRAEHAFARSCSSARRRARQALRASTRLEAVARCRRRVDDRIDDGARSSRAARAGAQTGFGEPAAVALFLDEEALHEAPC